LQGQDLLNYTQQIQRLADGVRSIQRARSLDDLLQATVHAVLSTLGAAQAAIEVNTAAVDSADRHEPSRFRSVRHPSNTALPELTRRALAMDLPLRAIRMTTTELDQHPRWGTRRRAPGEAVLQGWLATPLLTRDGRALGWLSASEKRTGEFSEDDEVLIGQLGQFGALALETALGERSGADEAAAAGVQEGEEEHVLQFLADEVRQRTGACFAGFAACGEPGDHERLLPRAFSMDAPQERAGTLSSAGALFPGGLDLCVPLRLDDARGDSRFAPGACDAAALPIASYLAVPVLSPLGQRLGVFALGHREPGRLTQEHERIVAAIAQEASIALENVRLYGELQRSESRARDAHDALALANRQKDQFLATLSHELRNRLAPIVNGMYLLRVEGRTSAAVDVIERHAQNLVRLVDDLLDHSRILRGRIPLEARTLEIGSLLRRALELAAPLLEQKSHQLSVDVPDGLVVEGDAARLTQVFSNLISNAASFTDRGGKLAVTAYRKRDMVVVVVEDNGIGISRESLPVLFHEFMQVHRSLDRSQGGLGLGLSIAKNLIEMHGGSIEAQSEGVGTGSRFIVRLPASTQMVKLPAVTPPRRAAAPIEGRRILVVDDNVDAAEILAEMLRQNDHEVAVAFSGLEALELMTTFTPELAILDIGLPGMDGYQLASRLRRIVGSIALIALSGFGQESDYQRSRAAGFDVHLVKPVRREELEQTLRQLSGQTAS
jgi:signal transduction histidine kinase/CheY-like chemotaxis protein